MDDIKKWREEFLAYISGLNLPRDDYRGIMEYIEEVPVQPEIIRCKDCKHYNAGFECLIEGYGIEYDEDYFCGSAERRTDEPDR